MSQSPLYTVASIFWPNNAPIHKTFDNSHISKAAYLFSLSHGDDYRQVQLYHWPLTKKLMDGETKSKSIKTRECVLLQTQISDNTFKNAQFVYYNNLLVTLVPEAFLYSLLANFVTRTSSFNFFYWHEALRAEKRKPLV